MEIRILYLIDINRGWARSCFEDGEMAVDHSKKVGNTMPEMHIYLPRYQHPYAVNTFGQEGELWE